MPSAIEKALVIIVGAGASMEAGLPTGNELKKKITQVLHVRKRCGSHRDSRDEVIGAAFHRLAVTVDPSRRDINPYLRAARRICDAMPQAISIDNYIDSHRDDPMIAICGKLAIARCILDAESKSSLQTNERDAHRKINFSTTEDTWFNAFFQLLTVNTQRSELPEMLSKVGVVCFNYDRCIEHYWHSALQNYYNMNEDEATAALLNLEIHHPYGTVGKLPWQHKAGGFAFGGTPEPQQLIELAVGLRTFTEGTNSQTSDVTAIRSLLESAKRLAFLGFAFHDLNIEFLFPSMDKDHTNRVCPVYATALGISAADALAIRMEIGARAGLDYNRMEIRNDLKCAQLFHEFSKGLSIR